MGRNGRRGCGPGQGDRRAFLKGGILAAMTGLMPFGSATRGASGDCEKPNFVLIMADDLGYGDVGCYGNTRIRTPHIDALAAGGVRFTDYHSNGAVCSPTRAALLTGRYQQRCNVEQVISVAPEWRQKGMPLAETTFAEALKQKGYRVGIFGKWHLGYRPKFNPVHQGFDEFAGYVSGNVDYHSHVDGAGYADWWKQDRLVPEEGYVTDLITDYGSRFIEANKDRPFCLYLPHEAVHYPLQGRNDPPLRTAGGSGRGIDGRRDRVAVYKEMLEVMDEGIGRILSTLRRLGLERKTLIIFCSDNGATSVGSNDPLRGSKGSLFEGGHRVPAIAYWPGRIAPGGVTDQVVLGMDWFPTMARLAGVKVDVVFDGVDLSDVLFDGRALPERTLFWRHRRQRAVRRGVWKLLVDVPAKAGEEEQVMLFDLREDLAEQTNLVSTHPQVVQELRAALAAWEKDVDRDRARAVNT